MSRKKRTPEQIAAPVEETTPTVADEIELEQLLAAAEAEPATHEELAASFEAFFEPAEEDWAALEPAPAPTRRMSGDEVASMLRQRRRETRLAEKGY